MSETFAPTVRIEHLGETGYALAHSQYCPALIPIFKAHGGRWQRDAKAWMIPAARVEVLEAATAQYRSAHASGWIAAGGYVLPLDTVIPGVSVDEDGNFWQIVTSDSRRFYDDQAEEWVEDWAAVVVIATAEQAADAAAKLAAEQAARDARQARTEARLFIEGTAAKERVDQMLLRDFGAVQATFELRNLGTDPRLGGLSAHLDPSRGLAWIRSWSATMDERPDVDVARAITLTDEVREAIEVAAAEPKEWG